MKKYTFLLCFLAVINLWARDIEVSQSYVVFDYETNQTSEPYTIKVSNTSSSDVSIGKLYISGLRAQEFNISSDSCSDTNLSSGGNCYVSIVFAPHSQGIKNAFLQIPYVSDNSYTAGVFLTNYQDTAQNVQYRLQPVIYDINISDQIKSGGLYTFKWSLVGYDEYYYSLIAVFDCSSTTIGECGNSYGGSDQLLASVLLPPVSVETSDWSYKGQIAHKFNYEYTVLIPDVNKNGDEWNVTGTDVVIRFYVLSSQDMKNNKPSLSLIIPGNVVSKYYDTSGRKIVKTICPSDGCE